MRSDECHECKKLFEAARDAIRHHVKLEGDWKLAELSRHSAERIAMLRDRCAEAFEARQRAVSEYRAHTARHEPQAQGMSWDSGVDC